MHVLNIRYKLFHIKRTAYKSDSNSIYWWIYSQTLIKSLYKAGIYKADSHKTDTFYAYQIKTSPKVTPCKAETGLEKQISWKKYSHIFLYIITWYNSWLFFPHCQQLLLYFSLPNQQFFTVQKTCSVPGLPDPRFIYFATTLHLLTQFGKVIKSLNILLKLFGICPSVYPLVITVSPYLSFPFPSSRFHRQLLLSYLHICMKSLSKRIKWKLLFFFNNQSNFHFNFFQQ